VGKKLTSQQVARGSAEAAMPSLIRRVMFTLTAAVVSLFVLVFIFIMYSSLKRETGEFDVSMKQVALSLHKTLADSDDPDTVRVAMKLFNASIQEGINAGTAETPVHLVVTNRKTGKITRTDGAPTLDLSGIADGAPGTAVVSEIVDTTHWRLYVAGDARWQTAMLDDLDARRGFLLRQLVPDMLRYLLLGLVVVLLPAWLAMRQALGPLRRLSSQVANRAPGDMTPLAMGTSYRELQPLQQALNRLFERVAAGLARERGFVHDAAHELRTPLAVISAQAHNLGQTVQQAPGTARNAAAEKATQQLEGAVARASHLTQQLLRLAQADASGQATRAPTGSRLPVDQAIDVMDLARDVLASFAPRAAQRSSELALLGPDRLSWPTQENLLRSVLENGVDNALRYGGSGCRVEVLVEPQNGTANTLHIRITDTGPGLAPDLRELAFSRFWRGPGNLETGAGLGLAIVQEAMQGLGGTASLGSGPEGVGCVLLLVLTRAGRGLHTT
jgi:two-component system, OmpR family, sensor histidine kinase QseC